MDEMHSSIFTRKALEMGLDPLEALRSRYRYLNARVEEFKALYLLYLEIDPYFWWWVDLAQQRQKLIKYAKRYKIKPASDSALTADMIETAKTYPVNQLFELAHGRTTCFNHNSKAHDLSYHSKNNTVRCFGACNRSFNPIDVLMLRDNMTFPTAVRFLQ